MPSPFFNFVASITLDADDNLYVPDPGTNRIVKFSNSGMQLATFTTSDITYPLGIALDRLNNMYITCENLGLLVTLASDGTVIRNYTISNDNYLRPFYITYDHDNNRIFLPDVNKNQIIVLYFGSSTKSRINQ